MQMPCWKLKARCATLAAPDTLDARFAGAMGQLLGPDFPSDIGLAVSGGGDSMAMLALAHNWARVWGVRLWVVTIDHGLRPESAAEAAMVARECALLERPHATLRWHWDGAGNVMDAARSARLALIDRWRAGLEHVLMAHTADDVAETFLMRLARGSGVDGLAAMQATRHVVPHPDAGHHVLRPDEVVQTAEPPAPTKRVAGVAAFSRGFTVLRPCLEMSRADLRHYARRLNVPWVDDPTNEDPKYDRTRVRNLLGMLGDIGLDAQKLTATAQRMKRASGALRARADQVAQELCSGLEKGLVIFERSKFEQVERDTQLRLLAAACMWVSGAAYKPRAESLEGLLDRLLAGGAGTLIGAKAETGVDCLFVFREFAAVAGCCVAYSRQGSLWDGRFRIAGYNPDRAELTIRALGEAVSGCKTWRDSGVPRAALMASPAIFEQDTLIAAPILGVNRNWHAKVDTSFREFLLSH